MQQFKRGMCLEIDGKIWKIVEFQHVKPGKGSAFTNTKLKNMETGAVVQRTYRDRDSFKEARIEGKEMQLLYSDGDGYHFMDQETYEQISLSEDDLGDARFYIRENDTVRVDFHDGRAIGIEVPTSAELTVVETEPWVKGDTATGATKPARLETGLTVQVPLFISEGEKIKVDTRTGDFLGRA